MANTKIWQGTSQFLGMAGQTPFGHFDADTKFRTDADTVAAWCAKRLGYPIVDVELQDLNFYAAFEQATTVYGNEIYAYQIRENYLGLEGANTSSFDITPINNQVVTPNMSRIISLTEQYGIEAGTGGNVDWKSGSFALTASVQDYDLNAWASASGYETGDLEIKKVFFESTPAIARFFDPYVGSGNGTDQMLQGFGWGNMSPAVNFLMLPMYDDLLRVQSIEFNDHMRKSAYTFELTNNKLRIFPIPTASTITGRNRLYFQFLLKSERYDAQFQDGTAKITNIGNVPYQNPQYLTINPRKLKISIYFLIFMVGYWKSIYIFEETKQLIIMKNLTFSTELTIENLRTYLTLETCDMMISYTKETKLNL